MRWKVEKRLCEREREIWMQTSFFEINHTQFSRVELQSSAKCSENLCMRMRHAKRMRERERDSVGSETDTSTTRTQCKRSLGCWTCVCWNDGKRVSARAHVRVDTLWQSWENYSIWSTYSTSEISRCVSALCADNGKHMKNVLKAM